MRYEITFTNVCEIRMGSPFNGADVILKGDFVPTLPNNFQDLCAISNSGNECYLVEWEHINGNPGFRIWKINAHEKSVKKSNRIVGCCKSIFLENDNLAATAWEHPKGDVRYDKIAFYNTPPDEQNIFDPISLKKSLHEKIIENAVNDKPFWTKNDLELLLEQFAPGKKLNDKNIQSILQELEKDHLIQLHRRDDRYLEIKPWHETAGPKTST